MKYLIIFLAFLLAGCNFPTVGRASGFGAVTVSWNAKAGANVYVVVQQFSATAQAAGSQVTANTSITFYPAQGTYTYIVSAYSATDITKPSTYVVILVGGYPCGATAIPNPVNVQVLHSYAVTATLP